MPFIFRSTVLAIGSVGALLAAATLTSPAGAEEPAQAQKQATPEAQGRPAVQAALTRSEANSTIDLSAGAAAPGALQVGQGGGPVDAREARLATIGGTTSAQGNGTAGAARVLALPKSDGPAPQVGKPRRTARATALAPVTDAAAIVGTMEPGFAACAKGQEADAQRSPILRATIGPSGEVIAAVVVTSNGMSPEAVACCREVVAHAKFSPVGDRGAVLQIRVNAHAASVGTQASTAP